MKRKKIYHILIKYSLQNCTKSNNNVSHTFFGRKEKREREREKNKTAAVTDLKKGKLQKHRNTKFKKIKYFITKIAKR